MSSSINAFSSSLQVDEVLLILIREDLKSQKVFDHLRALGLEDIFYQSDLAEIILKAVGLNAESEKDLDFYYCLVKEFAPQVTGNQQELNRLVGELFLRLMGRR